MAKAATKTKAAKTKDAAKGSTALATTGGKSQAVAKGDEPKFLAAAIKPDAGKGVSTAQEDNLVPLIVILQKGSPQVNKRDPKYMEGAEAGTIWMKSAPNPLVPGDDGFIFQPCFFSKAWVEWIPREKGGGYVGLHLDLPEKVERKEDPQNKNRIKYFLPNGNELIETRYHSGFVYLPDGSFMPYVIPFTSSGHTISRNWTFTMNSKRLDGVKPPSFASLFKFTSKFRKNAAGDWFAFEIEDAGWVQDPETYERGRMLFESFNSGEKRMSDDGLDDATRSGDDGQTSNRM